MTLRRSVRPALLAVLALCLLLPGSAPAQEVGPPQQQFVQEAAAARLVAIGPGKFELVLRGVTGGVTKVTGVSPSTLEDEITESFLRSWDARGFSADPPDGMFLVSDEASPARFAVVSLSAPKWERDGRTLSYTAIPVRNVRRSAFPDASQRATSQLRPGDLGPITLTIASPGPPLATVDDGFFANLRDVATEWSALIGLLFMGLIVFLIWRSLRLMPKTAPQTLKPDAKTAVGWEDIAGADDAKEELMEVVQFLRDPKKFRRYGANMPKGVLLHGPPGTGKTLLAKAVAHESGAQFFSQSASSFVEMFAGLGAARIRRLFAEARKNAPAIIFIDELDAVGGQRTGNDRGDREQTLNQLLVEMDGFQASEDIVVMAASNFLDALDPALLRPGRFDRQVFVSPPDVAGREAILKVHTASKPLHDVDLSSVAAQTSGLTGADLANLCNEAAIFSARRDGVAITQADFDMALERVVAGVQSKRVLQPAEKAVVAYHEAGHALCGELLPSVDKVHKVSIVPRGKALGFTLNLPEEDRYLKTREELLDHMAMLLGGRVAEQVVFGKITTGASDDLKRVAELTHAMVHEYAMGTADPAQRGMYETGQASDITRRIRDEEQRELAFEAQMMAERLITEHRDKLDELADQLLEHEVLERKQIDAIMHDTPKAEDRPRLTGIPTVTAAEELRPKDT